MTKKKLLPFFATTFGSGSSCLDIVQLFCCHKKLVLDKKCNDKVFLFFIFYNNKINNYNYKILTYIVELYPSKSYHLIQKWEAIKFNSEKCERLKSKNLFFYPKTNKFTRNCPKKKFFFTRKTNVNQKHNSNCQKSKGLSNFVVKICFLYFI